ncbi:HypC/HybG/HupF family hydrogenase formation chaperone [Sporomusa sphaeroides DSM 2875]|jgi:hydrogenase expression/formation protein HypC|uniref:HypC/HybG/HupF family hydrogenase formation chaperone n=1 Tax=Sporomusa sphaeroides TaxID=47679 RepID=UPI00202FF98A|nr:HypC/HybG/HupF family hydrogenase formation chaperone [Sporomusa sphaeroides]MCM0757691.1 HypC/HybG/HupF family hydrogenase formation chaperone [Sporomusa sphaeroides DSM 2875]
MCLAVPAQITERREYMATVTVSGVTRQVSLMLLPEAAVGDYVLIHAGFAIQAIDEAEARRTLELFKELEQYAVDS